MDLKTYIAINYDSFIDNVVMEQDMEFWQETLCDRRAYHRIGTLRKAAHEWQKRMEADAKLEALEEERRALNEAGQHEDWYRKLEDAQDILAEQERHR